MDKYTLTVNEYGTVSITRINEDETLTIFLADESNSDYQQYLVETDGGLPIPKESKK
jgi:hypothetical protein